MVIKIKLDSRTSTIIKAANEEIQQSETANELTVVFQKFKFSIPEMATNNKSSSK